MTILCNTLEELMPVLGPGPMLGLDLGTKTIGVAASDPARMMAMPVETIRRKKFSIDGARLQDLATERGASAFILGLPRNMDGSEGPRAQSARAFARNLVQAMDLPVALWDERLSTVAAERAMIDADASRRKRAAAIDNVAAAVILQGALDRLRQLTI